MEPMSTTERDPIERLVLFLLRHWLLFISLLLVGAGAALIATFFLPTSYRMSVNIQAPHYATPEFDQLVLSLEGNSTNDSIALTRTSHSRDALAREGQQILEAARIIANAAVQREVERIEMLSALRSEISDATAVPPLNAFDRATALVANLQATDIAEHRLSTLQRWEAAIPENAVVSKVGFRNVVLFGAFSGLTLAALIGLVRTLIDRYRNLAAPE